MRKANTVNADEKICQMIKKHFGCLCDEKTSHCALVRELVNLIEAAYEEGSDDAKESVGDWIDLSEFAPDSDWRD